MTNNIFIFLEKTYNNFLHKGIDAVNDYMPLCRENADVLSERLKAVCLTVCAFSVIMMVISPYGWLYASFPRPFYMALLYIMQIPDLPPSPTPEWGIHYMTLLMYFTALYLIIDHFEASGINKPFQKLSYSVSLMLLSFFVPFEFMYITFYDIFHSLPKYGSFLVWNPLVGETNMITIAIHSIMTFDITMTVSTIIIMYLAYSSMKESYDIKIVINRTSKILFCLFLLSYACWILIPLVQPDVVGWGSNWFPQTIYIEYGWFKDFGIPLEWTKGLEYGIVAEHWFKNDLVRYANHTTKLLSVIFMFYTFTPRRVS
jgi:hypothetical protein